MTKYFILFFTLFTFSQLNAQVGVFGTIDSRSLGAGNTIFNASNESAASLGNPALPAFRFNDSTAKLSIVLPSICGSTVNNIFSLKNFNYYFDHKSPKYLNDNDRIQLLSYFKDNAKVYVNANSTIFAVSYTPNKQIGSFTLAANEILAGELCLPKELAQVALNGNEIGKTYSFNNFYGNAWWLRSYSLSYAKLLNCFNEKSKINNLSLGFSAKYIQGFGLAKTDYMHASLVTNLESDKIDANTNAVFYSSFSNNFGVSYNFDHNYRPVSKFSIFPQPVANGCGLDLGLSCQIDSNFFVSTAITDIGKISWTQNVVKHNLNGSFTIDDLLNQKQIDSVLDFIDIKSAYSNSISTNLPTTLRFDIAYSTFNQNSINYNFAFDLAYGLTNTIANPGKLRYSLGTNIDFGSWLPNISTGISNDQLNKLRWSAGIGYTFPYCEIQLSTFDILSLLSSSHNNPYLSYGFSILVKIL